MKIKLLVSLCLVISLFSCNNFDEKSLEGFWWNQLITPKDPTDLNAASLYEFSLDHKVKKTDYSSWDESHALYPLAYSDGRWYVKNDTIFIVTGEGEPNISEELKAFLPSTKKEQRDSTRLFYTINEFKEKFESLGKSPDLANKNVRNGVIQHATYH